MPLSASERVGLVIRLGASAALSDETRISPAAAWDYGAESTNRGEIAADGREFAYLNLTAVDADANTDLIRRHTKTRGQGSERRFAASLNVSRAAVIAISACCSILIGKLKIAIRPSPICLLTMPFCAQMA